MNISDRQKSILLSIIKEFMQSAEPVGSDVVVDKYDIKASSATVRYEMVKLANEGLISKNYSSAGRVPTSIGIRYFLNELMEEQDLDYLLEVKIAEMIHKIRFDRDRLIKEAVNLLSEHAKMVGMVLTESSIIDSGLYYLLDLPEFGDKEVLKKVLILLEDRQLLAKLFHGTFDENQIKVLIGSELGIESLDNSAFVFTQITLYHEEKAILAAFGPNRMDYSNIIPLIRYVSSLISKEVSGW